MNCEKMWKDGLVWVASSWQNVDNCVGVRVLELNSFRSNGIVSRLELMMMK